MDDRRGNVNRSWCTWGVSFNPRCSMLLRLWEFYVGETPGSIFEMFISCPSAGVDSIKCRWHSNFLFKDRSPPLGWNVLFVTYLSLSLTSLLILEILMLSLTYRSFHPTSLSLSHTVASTRPWAVCQNLYLCFNYILSAVQNFLAQRSSRPWC